MPVSREEGKLTPLYPDPPYFWKAHTPENIERYNALKQAYADDKGLDVADVARVPEVPEDLCYLNPPAEPADGKWRLFGQQLSLEDELQSLEAAGIERLGTAGDGADADGRHVDRALELKRLAKSLLLNYLELTRVMGNNPSQGEAKVLDIKTILLNMHHRINEYRPHQAREQLIQLMQESLDSKRAETATIRNAVDKANRVLTGLASIEIPEFEKKETVSESAKTQRDLLEKRLSELWDQIDERFS
ncbi:MED7 protein-domain-containing protein [Echria macrotheca]|uniref:Mediator of RNA polymerase II transcription subunit 7 n=1 Tax=Echria macrotheca TaxID=438768 RepID=A0AAJ0BME9_9PEZI|nr:MED7 protein-domain-containing protein [Echria macrotheca]